LLLLVLVMSRAGKKTRARRAGQLGLAAARLGPARRSERVRAEPVFVAREKSESARLGAAHELARGSTQQHFII
jgi:hypothetical protein